VGFTRCNWEESVVQDRKASNEGEKVPRFFCVHNITPYLSAHYYSAFQKPMVPDGI